VWLWLWLGLAFAVGNRIEFARGAERVCGWFAVYGVDLATACMYVCMYVCGVVRVERLRWIARAEVGR
jgi:hypothetical protein